MLSNSPTFVHFLYLTLVLNFSTAILIAQTFRWWYGKPRITILNLLYVWVWTCIFSMPAVFSTYVVFLRKN